MNPTLFSLYNKPFKIFVTATDSDEGLGSTPSGTKARHEINVPDSKAVYEDVISSEPVVKEPPKPSEKPKKVIEKQTPFNKYEFLKRCQENDTQSLSQMDLRKSDDLNVVDDFGWNGLMIAACSNAVDAFSFLLYKNINYEVTDRSGRSALALAEKKGHSQILDTFRGYVEEQRQVVENQQEDSLKNESLPKGFHCEICSMHFLETSRASHSTSVLHQFNSSQSSGQANRLNYGIPVRNAGYQLMLKQGWNTRGLGPDESGRLYPLKTVLRKPRSGLGTKQSDPGRVTHFKPHDRDAVLYRPPASVKGRLEISRDYESNKRKERKLRKALS